MSITTGIGKKFLEEVFIGTHILSEGTPDTIKCALYGANALLSPYVSVYTTVGEVSGGAYTAGGVAVPLTVVGAAGSSRDAGTQFAHPYIQPTNDTEIIISGVGIRGCMLYNASRSNRNIFTLDFGSIITPSYGIKLTWGLSGVTDFKQVLIPLVAKEF